MATDNNQDNDRIDSLEAAFISLAETQRQLVELAQRHDMRMEMLQAIQRDQAATQQEQAATQEEQATAQQEQTAAIQRHDMEMEMLRAIQRDQAATQQVLAATQQALAAIQQELIANQQELAATQQAQAATQQAQAATQQDQAAAIERHNERMEMLRETQNQVVNLVQNMASMLHGAIDTQQEHSNDIRDLREGRDSAP